MTDLSREAVEALIVRLNSIAEGPVYGGTAAEAASALSSLLSERDAKNAQCARDCMGHPIDGHRKWVSLESRQAAEAEIASLRARYEAHTDYSIDLQRIIEDLCQGRPIREPKTTARHHYDMAVTADASLRARLEECERERDEARDDARFAERIAAKREIDAEARAEAAEAARAKAEEALEPFALVAELDIGMDEADDDLFRPISEPRNALAPRIKVGDLRRAHAAYAARTTGGNNGG